MNNIFENLILQNEGTIVDVRTPAEYMGAHAVGSINIPLNELMFRLDELQESVKPIIFCCASGARSTQASYYASEAGIDCINAGSWLNINYIQSQSTTNT